MGLRRIGALLAILSLGALASAQPRVPFFQPPLRQTDAAGYRTHIETLRGLVLACRNDATTCNAAAVGDDDRVAAQDETFQVRWQWLRRLLDEAGKPALKDRNAQLDEAEARLDRELAATGGEALPPAEFAPARRAATVILSRAEFRVVGRQSWIDRKIAQLLVWIVRFFTAAADFGHRAPWLVLVLEWSFVGLSAVGILFWVRRSMARERLAVSLTGVLATSDWQKESAEWADLARIEAERSNWRDAIHCLYWAGIVVLESRRLWRRDLARTPREYVELLQSHCAQQTTLQSQLIALRSLTRLFERIWYGLRGAEREDYAQALALFEDIRRAG
jgi:hypothetical protein